jgi:glycosyltransferase involved in cell wall biosynthesis
VNRLALNASSPADGGGPRLLVVAGSCPWPPTSGGKIDTFGRLRALRELGVRLEVVMTVKEEAEARSRSLKEHLGLDACYVVRRRRTLARALHPVWPFQVTSRGGKAWEALGAAVAARPFRAVLAEGAYVFPMSAALAHYLQVPLLHRVHNLESRYFLSLGQSERSLAKKVFFYLEALRFRRLERRMFQEAVNLCISTEEWQDLEAVSPGRNYWLPPALAHFPSAGVTPRPEPGRRFLITGSLGLPDTWHGVQWFLERVWPRIHRRRPEAVLTIAGRRPEAGRAAYLENLADIRAVFDVPDMTPLFQEADIFVSPMLHGAGVKIKTVEALAFGLPVVATPVAAQGCGLEHGNHLLIATGAEDFGRACLQLAEDPALRAALGERGRAYVQAAFDQKAHLRRLLGDLDLLG